MKHSGRAAKRNGARRVRPRPAVQPGPSDQNVLIRLAALRAARERGEVADGPPAPEGSDGVSPDGVSPDGVALRSAAVAVTIALLPIVVGLVVLIIGVPAQEPLGW
jgi:hypothetical protein